MAKKKQTAARGARLAHKPEKAPKPEANENDNAGRIRPRTKQAAAIEMLRSSSGTSIDALTKATGWQQHSVRGFLAGVVRKRLKLDLQSTVEEGVRIYRIAKDTGAKPVAARAARRKA